MTSETPTKITIEVLCIMVEELESAWIAGDPDVHTEAQELAERLSPFVFSPLTPSHLRLQAINAFNTCAIIILNS